MKNTMNRIAAIASRSLLLAVLVQTPVWAEVAAPGEYKIDPAHSTLSFSVSHLGLSDTVGRFNDFDGRLALNPGGTSSAEVNVRTRSVDTNHGKRDEHLRSPDFFNTRQYPLMHFRADQVSFNAAGEPVSITGSLSLHGKTRPLTLAVQAVGAGKDPWGGYRAGYNASAVIKRSEFGMNFMPGGIGDEVTLTLNIETIKQ
jgi:polyisoprenoid-binding protein YceI